MMRTVQLAIADAVYAAALRDALLRSGPWHVDFAEHADSLVINAKLPMSSTDIGSFVLGGIRNCRARCSA